MIRRMVRKFLDAPRVQDAIRFILDEQPSTPKGPSGIFNEDGGPVPVETIMKEFGVSQKKAVEIAYGRRHH